MVSKRIIVYFNKNIIVSAALMPETNVNPYYYGQDSSQMGKYLDVLMPMAYKVIIIKLLVG